MLITPGGKSLVAITSEKDKAGSGADSDAITIHELPETTTGQILDTSERSGSSSGRSIPITPVGSGIEKLKYPFCTGFTVPTSCDHLSENPAYHTILSIALWTSFVALAFDVPVEIITSFMNCSF